jgi:hypothetical protein
MDEHNEKREELAAGSGLSDGLGAIIGKWPGNETDDEILKALQELDGPEKHLRKSLEIAREALESCVPGDYSTGHVCHPYFDEDKVREALRALST